jgi:hypothetical protein
MQILRFKKVRQTNVNCKRKYTMRFCTNCSDNPNWDELAPIPREHLDISFRFSEDFRIRSLGEFSNESLRIHSRILVL